ncbi:DUF1129 family protein [Radiobacillus sp. PE A8.2]|uniref:DUF1129 family protein n=1 Tax=Radiobacillus sp. PE A8.2 TaxID=3380349 RepID=UPI00388D87DC
MNAKQLIALNNQKREMLNENNLSYYEEMLVYLRLSINKSEQQTEELLNELLDHLLDAQTRGKSAQEVFGEDPKAYCKTLANELPAEKTKNNVTYYSYLISMFLGEVALIVGIVSFFFDTPPTVSIGGGALLLVVILSMLFLSIFAIFSWLRWISGKQLSKIKEFFRVFILLLAINGIGFVLVSFIPDFGREITVTTPGLLIPGAILSIFAFIMNRRYKITKG